MDRTNEAINLFKKKYGKTPKEAGFPVIDIYERQSAFLYADTKGTIKAYKTHQNIVRWVMKWYVWPMVLAVINFIDAAFCYHDGLHWRCWVTYAFLVVWGVLIIVLWLKSRQLNSLVKLDENVTFLNY